MRQREKCAAFLENRRSSGDRWDSVRRNSDHGFGDAPEDREKSDEVRELTEDSGYSKIVYSKGWQIALTSGDCEIEKYRRGWQIRPKGGARSETDPKLIIRVTDSPMLASERRVKTANAEILCNRDDLDDLCEEKSPKNENGYGKIIFKEYLKLLPTEEARAAFIVKVLTKAVEEQKIFTISGNFPAIRKPLGKRGWIEKRFVRKMISMSLNLTENVDVIEKLLRQPPNFIWYTNKNATVRTEEKTIVNKFAGCYFTSKVDMCNNLDNVSWFYEVGVSNIQFPRCYNVYQPAQVEEFVQDFYITACTGILKWLLFVASVAGPDAVWSSSGTISMKVIFFALDRCAEHISFRAHEDIDGMGSKNTTDGDWAEFLSLQEDLVRGRETLKKSGQLDILEILAFTANIVKGMTECRPQSRIDGMRNVWILKPGDKSLGRGIVLKDSLRDILCKINQASKECTQYVVQKYIERPLLVHRTKVDVRQWFLITCTQPLVVWMYRDILLRFASRYFTLEKFHESIHLCNTTVQLKYRRTVKQDAKIPGELHWNLQDFKEYLINTGRETAWEKVIKPGIKENLIGALLASQEYMVNRKNSFQLYGADFLIMDDLSVWLIEINTNPRLHPPSSSVTEKLYPEILEDTMKVVLDYRKNKKAARGKFECIYKQRNPFSGNVPGKAVSLGIRGRAVATIQSASRRS